jgi:hypothetical protein
MRVRKIRAFVLNVTSNLLARKYFVKNLYTLSLLPSKIKMFVVSRVIYIKCSRD